MAAETADDTREMREEEQLDRVDRAAAQTVAFKQWLEDLADGDPHGTGTFAGLYFITDDEKYEEAFKFDEYAAVIREDTDDENEALLLTELLLSAEAQWRVDHVAHSRSRAALGLTTPRPKKVVLKCDHKFRSGRICGKRCVPGSSRCDDHGGALIDPEARRSILISAYTKLVEGSDVAVTALIQVAEHGRSEIARVQAAKEILDRVGMAPELHLTISSDDAEGGSRLESLRDRLLETRERIIASPQAIIVSATVAEPEALAELPSPDGDDELLDSDSDSDLDVADVLDVQDQDPDDDDTES